MSERMMDGPASPGRMNRAIVVRVARALLLVAAPAACGRQPRADLTADSASVAPAPSDGRRVASVQASRRADPAAVTPARTPSAARPTILFIGTSLTAGLGLDPESAFPAVVGHMLDSAGRPARIVNAGISGETSAGARARIDWVLRQPADVIVLETGANDGLRGLSVSAARDNIQTILERIRAKQPAARVLLVQMEAPPNLGSAYTTAFHAMYPELAKANRVELVPFLLNGVAGIPSLNQEDGIHPNRAGAQIVARTVFDALVKRPIAMTATH
jgi:acyl-CoA thioesterase-1